MLYCSVLARVRCILTPNFRLSIFSNSYSSRLDDKMLGATDLSPSPNPRLCRFLHTLGQERDLAARILAALAGTDGDAEEEGKDTKKKMEVPHLLGILKMDGNLTAQKAAAEKLAQEVNRRGILWENYDTMNLSSIGGRIRSGCFSRRSDSADILAGGPVMGCRHVASVGIRYGRHSYRRYSTMHSDPTRGTMVT